MQSQLDLFRQASLLPEGIPAGTDLSSIAVGTVTGLDVPAGQVQVQVGASDPVWLPAAPYIYDADAKVRVRRSVLNGARLEFCEGPLTPGALVVTGKIVSVGSDTVVVNVLGAETTLPFVSSTYDVDDLVSVLRHPSGFGVPQIVLGLAGVEKNAADPGGGSSNPGEGQLRQATISPQDSGSFKSAQGRWDSWNTDRYGGVKALWQGNQYGSGPMVGWAGYGDQVVNLHADEITGMWLDVQRSDSSVSAAKVAVFQGSPDGSRPGGAPGAVGDTAATPALTPEQGTRIQLPASAYEAWRTGGIKGLRTVGGDYLAVYGASRGGAMVLTVQYRVVV